MRTLLFLGALLLNNAFSKTAVKNKKELSFCKMAAKENPYIQFVANKSGCSNLSVRKEWSECESLWSLLTSKKYKKIEWNASLFVTWVQLSDALEWKSNSTAKRDTASDPEQDLVMSNEIEKIFSNSEIQKNPAFQNFVIKNSFCVNEGETEQYQSMMVRLVEKSPEDFLNQVAEVSEVKKLSPPEKEACPLLSNILEQNGVASAVGYSIQNEISGAEHQRDRAESILKFENKMTKQHKELISFFEGLRPLIKN